MGHKVHPIGFRTGVTMPWRSRWYAPKRTYGGLVVQDAAIRRYLRAEKELSDAGLSRIDIERMGEGEQLTVWIRAARVGLVIGSQGRKIDRLEQDLAALTGVPVNIKVIEVESAEMDAQIVARSVADELERRTPYRRVLRMVAERVMNEGARGVRIRVKGRLGGAEIARKETTSRGKLPMQTLRADVDFGQITAVLSKGTIGVTVWIYKGDRLKDHTPEEAKPGTQPDARQSRRRGPRRGPEES